MLANTDNIIEQVTIENPGLPENESYVFCNNKIPVHKGLRGLTDKPINYFNSIAINTLGNNYICLDFDGYSTADNNDTIYKQEKQTTAEKVKNKFIQLLDKQTRKYRIDKTASNKFHIWLKHPNVPNKQFLKLPKFLTADDGSTVTGIVEIFSQFDKHNVHLAGSTITENNNIVGVYENVYAGASFDELDTIDNVRALLISAITGAGYLQKIEKADKKSNTIKYYFQDSTHNGFIKQVTRNGKYYFSYLESEIEVIKHFYVTDKNDFSIDNINSNCQDEFKSILSSIYYYLVDSDIVDDTSDVNVIIENQETSNELIQLYKKYWNNTSSKVHYLMLATSHVLVKYLNFNESDLLAFFDELADNVDIDVSQHRGIILEGLKSDGAVKKYGIPTIIDILQCGKDELNFLSKNSDEIRYELEHLERIKPTLTDEIIENEKKFQKIKELQLNNHYDAVNTYIKIKPTLSVTDLIAQILSNTLLNEKDNIAKLLLAMAGVMIGTNRTYIFISGVSSAGKSALVKTVKQVIPSQYKLQIDDSSDKSFERYTEDKGKFAYDRMIIDYGDKGNTKEFDKAIDNIGHFQNLITDGSHVYRVTNNENNTYKGVKDLTIISDGFAIIITTTKDVLAKIDDQKITRSEIIYVGNNSKDDISDFNAQHGIQNIKNQVSNMIEPIQSHFLYNLNKYNDTDAIITFHWRKYITRLLKANHGVNREIDSTMNALKSYCWLEIDRLHQVIGTDNKTYYIPASDIVSDFISIYKVKSSNYTSMDNDLIEAIKNAGYMEQDDVIIDDGSNLDNQSIRKELSVFTYQDIDSLLKQDENAELRSKINNISDTLRKLENNNILGRLTDRTKQRNVIYYIKEKSLSLNKQLELLPISDDDITNAIKHLKYHEVLTADDDDSAIYGRCKNKFSDDVDFSFINQRHKNDPDFNDKSDDDNDDAPGTIATAGATNSVAINPGENVKDNINKITTNTGESTNIVNLHCHTDESVGDGAVSIEKLVDTAVKYNQKAIALTNHGTLNGLYKFNNVCRKKGIKAINGIEAYISEKRYHLIMLAKNYKGYQDLLKLHNKNVEYMKANGLKRNDKYVNGGIYYTNIEQDKDLLTDVIALSGCISGQIPQLLLNGEYEQAKQLAVTYNSIFNKFYLELQFNGLKEQEKLNTLLIELSNDTGIQLTVTGDVHYIDNKDDWNAIKYAHRKGSKAPASNNSFMITAPVEFAESTITIADSIASYNINTSLHIPKPQHKREWLKEYCFNQLKVLDIDDAQHRKRLEKELAVIKDEIADYHILLYEIVETIKTIDVAPGGRGSAVGSLVCYLLGFHEVDPLKYNLLFERFLNSERIQKALASDNIDTSLLPDIDLNIADDRKDEVFAVLEKKYKYVAKVMTYSRLKADNKTITKINELYPLADVIDLKYNLSIHAGGVILSTESFNQYLPVTLTKDNEIVTDCDLAEVEARGGIKYDLLGESSSKINKDIKINDNEINSLVKYIKQHPLGISQFTGYSARKYLKNNDVKTFDDLLKATALIRTGSNESWIFQEDMMQEAVKYNITYADADYLRKPRGNKQEKENKVNKIIATMKANGCTEQEAELFKNYHNNYSFNKSHAVAYTLESLKNAKLKKEHTALFFERKLNHAKDPITIAELFDDAIKLGVKIIPPSREYYKLDAKADGNKLYIGSKFIKGISSKEPIVKGKFNKTYKAYLRQSNYQKLYSIGAYNKNKLPGKLTSLGYKTIKDKVIVATISANGLNIMWFEKSKYYSAGAVFDKGATISDVFIESYASI